MTAVGFVGAGAMGTPMVERLVDAGYTTNVFARREDVLAPLVRRGAIQCSSIAEVASKASVMVLCVFSDEQVVEVCLGESGLLASMNPGAVLALHTTGSPMLARTLHAKAQERGVAVVDAPVSGGPIDIRSGKLTVLLGGAEKDVSTCTSVLSAYADPIIHVGGIGAAQVVKLINNALLAANLALALEAARVGHQLGIETATLVEGISHCSGESHALSMVGAATSAEQLLNLIRPFLRKDLSTVSAVARELDLDLGALEPLGWGVLGE
jgi:3-hydroxyisobutyrate dehydrogenase-like beta-hydroxyacid dehydrogenase